MKANIKRIIIFAIILANTMITSCVKEELGEDIHTEADAQIDFTIAAEQFSDVGVKSSSQTPVVIHKEIIKMQKGFAEVKVTDDGYISDKLPISTKAGASNYTILVYNSDNTYNRTFAGYVDFNGKFSANGKILLDPGTYKFVCVANGIISRDNVSVTFNLDNNPDISSTEIALLSKVETVTIKPGKNSIKLTMQNMQTGVKVMLSTKEVGKTLPPSTAMGINVSTSNSCTYGLLANNLTPTSYSSLSTLYRGFKGSVNGYYYESDYEYFIESAGTSSVLPYIRLGFASLYNDPLYNLFLGMNLKNVKLALSNIDKFNRNKRYTIQISLQADHLGDIPHLPEKEIYNLPAWRFAPRYMAIKNGKIVMQKEEQVTGTQAADTGCYSWDNFTIGGTFKFASDNSGDRIWLTRGIFYDAKTIIDEITGKPYVTPQTGTAGKYYLPSIYEYSCILPFYAPNELISFRDKCGLELRNEPHHFNYNNEKSAHYYDSFYWSQRMNISPKSNNYATHEIYAIKLYSSDRVDYIKSCAYRYKWINDETNWKNSYLEIKVIYVGLDGEMYRNNINERNRLMDIFDNWDKNTKPENYGYKYYTILKFYATKQNHKENNTPTIMLFPVDSGHGSIYIIQVTQKSLCGRVDYSNGTTLCYLPVRLIRE